MDSFDALGRCRTAVTVTMVAFGVAVVTVTSRLLGSPAVLQTVVATAPLLVVAYESTVRARLPDLRVLAASCGAATGVGAIFVLPSWC